MSEGISQQQSQDPQQQHDINQQQRGPRFPTTESGSGDTRRRAAPPAPDEPPLAQSPAGALLVQLYGKTVLPPLAQPSLFQREYASFLTNLLEAGKRSTKETAEGEALSLLNATFAGGSRPTDSFDDHNLYVQSIENILVHHHTLPRKTERALTLGLLAKSLDNADNEAPTGIFAAMDPLGNALGGGDGGDTSNNLNLIAGRLPQPSDDHVSHVLIDLGPSCTRSSQTFREVLQELGNVTEASLARLLFFLSQTTLSSGGTAGGLESGGAGNTNDTLGGLSSALLSSLLPSGSTHSSNSGNAGGSTTEWNMAVVAQVLNEDYGGVMDWNLVAESFDFPGFQLTDTQQFRVLLELYRAGAGRTPPLVALTSSSWRNTAGQLSVLEAILAVPPSVFLLPLDDEELADAATAPPSIALPNPQGWASARVLNRLLQLSDVPSLFRRVRDLFVKCLLQCPEVLLCSLVRLQLRMATASPGSANNNNNNAGLQLKQDVMRELIPLFFRSPTHPRVQNGPAALRRLYAISPPTVVAACLEAWRSTATEGPSVRLNSILHIINIARLLPSPTEAVGSLLSGKDVEFSLAMAFVMADHDYLQLKVWLSEKFKSGTAAATTVVIALLNWIRVQYPTAAPRADPNKAGIHHHPAPLCSLENVVTSLQLLREVDPALLNQTPAGGDRTLGQALAALIEAVVQTFPSLRSHFMNPNAALAASSLSSGMPAPNMNQQQQAMASGGRSPSPGGNPSTTGTSDDVEEMATQYFQNIYTSKQSIGEIVEMLKRFKSSGHTKENEIFACMVHNLFDEYRFFSKYPEKELRITGILFGALIQEQLVSSITLGIALRYVLEALRKPPTSSSGKMFKFGMFALEQFKGRLHEWPQYCSHIVQIPHLKEKYGDLVAEIELEMTKSNQNRAAAAGQNRGGAATGAANATTSPAGNSVASSGSSAPRASATTTAAAPAPAPADRSAASAPTLPQPPAEVRLAEFGPKLGRAVTDTAEESAEAPPDNILDRVQFMINNMAPSNVEAKAQELREMLEPRFFAWLGQFLVVKRISTQANFHALYLSFLDALGDYGKGLVEAILKSAYHNIGKLLRSPKITTSSSERSYLKNLGIWLGQITLARNRPILQIMLDAKELLLQGYETGKLIAVAPFLAKTLEGAKSSVVFRPPNPWLMGILGVFRSVYNVEGLKMNIKFEVEVLCKNLGIKLEDIQLRNQVLDKRIAPSKERNPDFNIKSAAAASAAAQVATSVAAPTGPKPPSTPGRASSSPETHVSAASAGSGPPPSSKEAVQQQQVGQAPQQQQQEGSGTVIPNLAAYVTVNPSLPQLLQSQSSGALSHLSTAALRRCVPIAVDKAIREIIQPVVERSVTIACITTKEVVTKDFAMEADELKMRKAGQFMVANLAGSLALVTCREPLRSSVSQHLRRLLTTDTAAAGGKLSDQEQNVIEQCVQICATDNLELGCMLIEKAATEKAVKDVDEALQAALQSRRSHAQQQQQALASGGQQQPFYDPTVLQSNSSSRYPAALPPELQPQPGGLSTEQYQLYESFHRAVTRPQQSGGSLGTAGGGMVPAGGSNPGLRSLDDKDAVGVAAQQQRQQQQPPASSAETLAQLAAKLDASVTALLAAAGQRAQEVKLAMLPSDHTVRQLLGLVKQIMPNAGPTGNISRPLTTTEQDVVLGFSQGIFKRLYELSLGEPLRLETLVALLENINSFCPKLGKDMGTWATYAPTNTEQQRRLHRTVLLLLVRSRLLAVAELDAFLAARTDNGRSPIWVEFSLLFIRTAFLERISTPPDFPKLMDLMTRIAEGKSLATPQIVSTYRKPIVRMLEEIGASRTGMGVGGASFPPSAMLDQQQQAQQQQQGLAAAHSGSGRGAAPAAAPANAVATPISSTVTPFSVEDASSLSQASLNNLTLASRKVAEVTEASMRSDPANARPQIAALLDGWIRLQSDAGAVSEKSLAQYLQVLQQIGVGKVEESTERFLRLSTLVVVDAVLKSAKPGKPEGPVPATSTSALGSTVLNHTFIDMYCQLLVILFRHMNNGGTAEQIGAQRLGVLNKILGSIVRSMMWHFEQKKAQGQPWDQRPWFRLFLNLILDVNKPDPSLENIRLQILSVFGSAFHVCQPMAMPGFAFAWLELVSHRHFLPNVMLIGSDVSTNTAGSGDGGNEGESSVSATAGWHIMHQLLMDHFLFLEPYLARIELTPPIKKLYEGTLRVLLVLLHDFPSFLAGHFLSFLNVVPHTCVQLRNIILSATPKGMNPPDPFTPNLKIDLLADISKSPRILSNVFGPLEGIRGHLDAYLKGGDSTQQQQRNQGFLHNLPSLLYKEGTTELAVGRVNSLVLYVGAHAIARLHSAQFSLSRTPEIQVFMRLMEWGNEQQHPQQQDESGSPTSNGADKSRYICLNAIANQLRFPSSHTHYFSCVMLYLFSESKSVAVKEQVTRVLLERLIVNRPHPWGLLITFMELIKNQRYGFWNFPFVRCATEIERVFESVARSCMQPHAQRLVDTTGAGSGQGAPGSGGEG